MRAKILKIQTKDLRPHDMLGRIGLLPEMIQGETKKGKRSGSNREDHKERAKELSTEFEALVEDIATNGILEPLKVVRERGGWAIADGRNRWLAWREVIERNPKLKTKGMPCIEIDESEAHSVILSGMTRRHMTKQARALMAVKIFPSVAESAKAGRPKKSPDEQGIMTQKELSIRIGVGLATVEEACLFWRKIKLECKPQKREDLMNQVFAGISFADAMNGDQGRKTSAGKKRPEKKIWTLFNRNANSLKGLWKDYEGLKKDEDKVEITEKLVEALKAAPADVQAAIKSALEGGGS